VPALDSFHETIFKIWHEAWPKKDTAMLRQLLPEVEKGISQVASAQLPGILSEKKSVWEQGVQKLQRAGSEYRSAVAAKDESKMLAAAEILHSRFEALMRAIRPALKELDDFHAVLYMLYQRYLPKHELENIKSSVVELKQKMAALNAAKLPERLKPRESEFQAARAKLSRSVEALESSTRSNREKTIKDAVETVHSNYRALDKIIQQTQKP
jgi:DNA transposition AAA+ family ATPase